MVIGTKGWNADMKTFIIRTQQGENTIFSNTGFNAGSFIETIRRTNPDTDTLVNIVSFGTNPTDGEWEQLADVNHIVDRHTFSTIDNWLTAIVDNPRAYRVEATFYL